MIRHHPRYARVLLLLVCLACGLAATGAARVKKGKASRPAKPRTHQVAARRARSPRIPIAPYAAALVVDAETNRVLYQKAPDVPRAPASLTKMMTELLTLEAAERGEISLSDELIVPREATLVRGSRVRLRLGEKLPLMEVLRAMSIASANDAAVTLAVHVAGSEDRFVDRMNRRANELGMWSTHYVNPHGLDRIDQPGSLTTARDLSILARELLKHSEVIRLSSTVSDTIRGHQIIHTTNRLLGRYDGVNGLKTGYTSKAGFCLVTTAERGGMRVISVLLGATSNRRRFSESAGLLSSVFDRFEKIRIIRKGQDLGRTCNIPGGQPPQVRLVAGEDVDVMVPKDRQGEIQVKIDAPVAVLPPVAEGKSLGFLQVLVGDSLALESPAVAGRPATRAGFLDQIGFHFGRLH